jgi:5'-AMP-activated protein kinase, catalytic alpha subunit
MGSIGQYTTHNVIGQGTFGIVRLAKNKNGQEFAIKSLELEQIKTLGLSTQVEREISHLKKLHHVNIIKLHEVLKSNTRIFLVCELANSGDLFDMIATKHKLSESTARELFKQIVSGVAYCHEHGIAHRDLKPENILLHNGIVKISDFGLSNCFSDTQSNESVVQLQTTCTATQSTTLAARYR